MALDKVLSYSLTAIGSYLLYEKLRSRKIFVSYKYIEDSRYKNLLLAWSKNVKFELKFSDVSSDISIDSFDLEVIKEGILPSIKSADIFLCIIGEKTHKSEMVKWEIEQAKKYSKPIVAVKTLKSNNSPACIKSSGAKWAMSFTKKSILDALSDECREM